VHLTRKETEFFPKLWKKISSRRRTSLFLLRNRQYIRSAAIRLVQPDSYVACMYADTDLAAPNAYTSAAHTIHRHPNIPPSSLRDPLSHDHKSRDPPSSCGIARSRQSLSRSHEIRPHRLSSTLLRIGSEIRRTTFSLSLSLSLSERKRRAISYRREYRCNTIPEIEKTVARKINERSIILSRIVSTPNVTKLVYVRAICTGITW